MTLNEFIKQIFENPSPHDLSVEEKAIWIYQNHFCRRVSNDEMSSPRRRGSPDVHEIPAFAGMTKGTDQEDFFDMISKKSQTLTTWIDIDASKKENDEITTTFQGLNIKARRGEWRTQNKKIQLRFPHFILGDDSWFRCYFHDGFGKNKKATARLYLNIVPEAVPYLSEECRKLLKPISENMMSIKAATNLRYYQLRRDPCVIYFQKRKEPYIPFVLRPLIQKIQKLKSLRDENMPLTCHLAPGVSYAEEPRENGMSFGMHRCRIIAQALQEQSRMTNLQDWICAIDDEWRRHGLMPDTPWRSSKS